MEQTDNDSSYSYRRVHLARRSTELPGLARRDVFRYDLSPLKELLAWRDGR
ncbi:hypothetical protein [Nocardia sp. NPDC004604]|uniref:hypothetical protein n=1 Tax=Nocardia sp. NPDC004604 TaxID=3157013 RepID=UPI0033A84884